MHDRLGLILPETVGLPAWRAKIIVTDAGAAHPGAAARNAEIALTEDPGFARAIRLDALRGQVMVCGPLPWARHWRGPRPWTEEDDTRALLWLQNEGIFVRSRPMAADVVDVIAEANAHHPVIDYYRTLGWPNSPIWDGEPRVGGGDHVSWLTRYCGVEDSPYARAVSAGWAACSVARLLDPGCRAPVPLLGGGGVDDKSTVYKVLAGAFFGAVGALGLRGVPERLRSSWIIEITGLEQLRRREWRGVINFAARDSDEFLYRGRRHRRPRPFVVVAATELQDFPPELADAREWCFVRCGAIDVEGLVRDLDQFWAELLVRYGARTPDLEAPLALRRDIGVWGMRDEAAVLRRYLRECCEASPASLVEKNELCENYNRWRRAWGLAPVDKRWLGRDLKRAFPKLHHYRPEKRPFEDHRRQYYRDLKLISGERS
jgi:putative DNA primase/helicase